MALTSVWLLLYFGVVLIYFVTVLTLVWSSLYLIFGMALTLVWWGPYFILALFLLQFVALILGCPVLYFLWPLLQFQAALSSFLYGLYFSFVLPLLYICMALILVW